MTSDISWPDRVQRRTPCGPIGPKHRVRLRFDQIQPVIRIAHITEYPLNIPERIIYDHEFVLVLQGEGFLRIDGADLAFSAGSFLFLPPFTPHTFISDNDLSAAHVAVHFDFCPGILRWPENGEEMRPYEVMFPAGLTPPRMTSFAPGHWAERALRDVVASFANAAADPLSGLDATMQLCSVIVQMLRWGRSRTEPLSGLANAAFQVNRRRIAAALDYIAAHLAEPITADTLAGIAGISRSRFVSVFREFTGLSPQQFVQNRRIDEARRLLANPALSIKQVAALTGFEDSFYFSRVFRKVDGLSPTQFRAAALANPPGQNDFDGSEQE
jgi:AraC-like DNA-binding protein